MIAKLAMAGPFLIVQALQSWYGYWHGHLASMSAGGWEVCCQDLWENSKGSPRTSHICHSTLKIMALSTTDMNAMRSLHREFWEKGSVGRMRNLRQSRIAMQGALLLVSSLTRYANKNENDQPAPRFSNHRWLIVHLLYCKYVKGVWQIFMSWLHRHWEPISKQSWHAYEPKWASLIPWRLSRKTTATPPCCHIEIHPEFTYSFNCLLIILHKMAERCRFITEM